MLKINLSKARPVPRPAHDKTATDYVYGNPYRRIRQSNGQQFVMVKGKPVTLQISLNLKD